MRDHGARTGLPAHRALDQQGARTCDSHLPAVRFSSRGGTAEHRVRRQLHRPGLGAGRRMKRFPAGGVPESAAGRQAQRKTGMKMHLRHIAHVMLVALMVISGNALAVDDPENYRLSESALQKYERATVAM